MRPSGSPKILDDEGRILSPFFERVFNLSKLPRSSGQIGEASEDGKLSF